ncbi:cytoplasmic chaperone TorD [Salmonella enterica]|nr:cytoplasmic chaperone TorD [Salmonella enterica]
MTPEQMALTEAINSAGGQSELARKLTAISGCLVRQQQVWNWLNREKKPSVKQTPFIEKVTGITKERLRPDVFKNIS